MEPNEHSLHKDDNSGRRFTTANIVLFVLLAIAAFYLIAEHRAHLLGWLPWLLILACPLLHVFMHRGHGGHGGHGGDDKSASQRREQPHQH